MCLAKSSSDIIPAAASHQAASVSSAIHVAADLPWIMTAISVSVTWTCPTMFSSYPSFSSIFLWICDGLASTSWTPLSVNTTMCPPSVCVCPSSTCVPSSFSACISASFAAFFSLAMVSPALFSACSAVSHLSRSSPRLYSPARVFTASQMPMVRPSLLQARAYSSKP